MSASSPKLPPSLMLVTHSPFTYTWGQHERRHGTCGVAPQGVPELGTRRPCLRPLAGGWNAAFSCPGLARSPPPPRPAYSSSGSWPHTPKGKRPSEASAAGTGQGWRGEAARPGLRSAGKPALPPPRRVFHPTPYHDGPLWALVSLIACWVEMREDFGGYLCTAPPQARCMRQAPSFISCFLLPLSGPLPQPVSLPGPVLPAGHPRSGAAVNGTARPHRREGPGQDSLSGPWARPAQHPCCAFTAQARVRARPVHIVHCAERSLRADTERAFFPPVSMS